MRYTPIFVPAILALLVFASTVFRSPMGVDPAASPAVAAVACDPKQADCDFSQTLGPLLRNIKSIRAFKFTEPCRKCHEANLSQKDFVDIPATVPLSADDATYFLVKFGDPSSYVTGIQKAMPFFANYGFLLEGRAGRSILLLSTFSKNVRLLTDNPEQVLIANIDPLFPEINTWLARISK